MPDLNTACRSLDQGDESSWLRSQSSSSKHIDERRLPLLNYPHYEHPAKRNTGLPRPKPRQFSPKAKLKLLLLFIFFGVPTTGAIQCFCTDDHCMPAYGACESSVCLVGLRRPGLEVIRTCGDEPLGCQHNLEHWVDLCACDTPFCNTFSYLRELTQDNAFPPPPLTADNAQTQFQPQKEDQFTPHHGSRHHALMIDDDTRIFQRVDGPPGEYIDEHGIRRLAPLSTRTSRLTFLIVVIPLVVLGITVSVIFLNYYCTL